MYLDHNMDTGYFTNSSSSSFHHSELWRSNPLNKQAGPTTQPPPPPAAAAPAPPAPSDPLGGRHHAYTPGADYGVNAFTLSPMELDPLANIFTYNSPYKSEYSASLKEKNPQDVADALLSLKHAVVHPSQMTSGQLSPLSPPLPHIAQSVVGPAIPHTPAFSYSVSHHHAPGPYSPGGGIAGYNHSQPSSMAQYPGEGNIPCPQITANQAGTSPSGAGGTSGMGPGLGTHNMFPSMSVNVSMSMNVGMGIPGSHPGQQPHPQASASGPPHPDQWQAPPPASPGPYSNQYTPSMTSMQPHHYPNHSQGQGYATSYSFSSDLRSPSSLTKDAFYSFRSGAPCGGEDYKGGVARLYGLSTPVSLRRHCRSYSPGGGATRIPVTGITPDSAKVNLCRICGKTYARPSTLKTHMRTHSGEKPYRCQTCNKSFSQAANLTAHTRTHSGEKPFRCPVCERRFSQSSSVTTHMRTHSGERPYRCRMCKKAFSDSSTLTKHLRIHSGEKPYQCKLCLLRFSQSGNLNRHMRVHANNGA